MAQENDPLKPVLQAVQAYQQRILEIWKGIFKKLSALLGKSRSFFDKIIQNAKDIAGKVGKGAVDTVVNLCGQVFGALDEVPLLAKQALKLGQRIIDTIQKAADPNKAIKLVKKLFQAYVKLFARIAELVFQMMDALDPLGKALRIIDTFRLALVMIFKWIADVPVTAVGKARTLLKKVAKLLRAEIKEALKFAKEVRKLAPV